MMIIVFGDGWDGSSVGIFTCHLLPRCADGGGSRDVSRHQQHFKFWEQQINLLDILQTYMWHFKYFFSLPHVRGTIWGNISSNNQLPLLQRHLLWLPLISLKLLDHTLLSMAAGHLDISPICDCDSYLSFQKHGALVWCYNSLSTTLPVSGFQRDFGTWLQGLPLTQQHGHKWGQLLMLANNIVGGIPVHP